MDDPHRPTPRLEAALYRARSEARTLGMERIGTEHVLLALAEDPAGIAGQVLDELGIRPTVVDRLRAIMTSPGYEASTPHPSGG